MLVLWHYILVFFSVNIFDILGDCCDIFFILSSGFSLTHVVLRFRLREVSIFQLSYWCSTNFSKFIQGFCSAKCTACEPYAIGFPGNSGRVMLRPFSLFLICMVTNFWVLGFNC